MKNPKMTKRYGPINFKVKGKKSGGGAEDDNEKHKEAGFASDGGSEEEEEGEKGNGSRSGGGKKKFDRNFLRGDDTFDNFEFREDTAETRIRISRENDTIDNKYGFKRISGPFNEDAWLLNMHPTEVLNEDKRLVSAVDYYFIQMNGGKFRATIRYNPYFYVLAQKGFETEVQLYLTRKYAGYISKAEIVVKEDLDLPNHLVGLKQKYLKLTFVCMADLTKVRKDILPAVKKNREREEAKSTYNELLKESYGLGIDNNGKKSLTSIDHLDTIIDIREHDVPYHMRVSIDKNIQAGLWYNVQLDAETKAIPVITRREELLEPPECSILAYDIETTKSALKFPDATIDQIMMISYMVDGEGYLLTNREIVGSDVASFNYSPKAEFCGEFTVYNDPNEMTMIQRFFDHILDVKPHVIATYNGDFFDWPFIEARARICGLNMMNQIGFSVLKDGVYSCRPCIHMDCFNWVKRDSYLPVGSQNLKAVARAKLRYDPVEVDPEDMCELAVSKPHILATYSVSDAVATYYLYMKYVHPFIFALCTIIPLEPDEVLRKGTGTLCEALLMVQAFRANVIYPNKQEEQRNKLTEDGHMLEQETYIGGHVEALESGVFRSDLPCRFKLDPEAFEELISGVEKTLKYTLEEEEQIPLANVTNFEEIVEFIKSKLTILRDSPMRQDNPLIYHLDVGAMYPNIILTNRLQPSAIVDEVDCSKCDFNKAGAKCQRQMEWAWRGEFMPANRTEHARIQNQLQSERFPTSFGQTKAYNQLSKEERADVEKKRLAEYCRKVYKKTHVTRTEIRYQTVCMQENSFYVDTVRAFRDRRYEYKGLSKVAKGELTEAMSKGDADKIKSARNREILFDSLQLAYKCILNSFYGYVYRKGSRWMSMEMAGIVCHTGGNIIRKAREIIEKIGRPLELDTDGIWCCLPSTFPETVTFRTNLEKRPNVKISYPNAVLNLMVKSEFTNDQYHDLVNPETLEYKIRTENSIFFEVDGPYLAMILPASKEEGKRLKKRYAVYNKDRTLAELKGFEVKRRGELQLVKNFQSNVFNAFLNGDTLENCYASAAKIANYWLDVLDCQARATPDSELFELVSENRNMSRKLDDYGQQKSTSISTAKRLAEFLGDQMVKDAGLSMAIPLAIFQSELSVKRYFLRRWLKDNALNDFDIRSILDWDYYIERLSGTIQKIITIPAAMQGIPNPVPRVTHPDWLHKRILDRADIYRQRKISDVFKKVSKSQISSAAPPVRDIEEIGGGPKSRINKVLINTTKRKRNRSEPDKTDYTKQWSEVITDPPPPMGKDKESIQAWLAFHKKKWDFLRNKRREHNKRLRLNDRNGTVQDEDFGARRRQNGKVTIGGFLKQTQSALINCPWQVLQVVGSATPGIFRLWALVGDELHQLRLIVPRKFYLNLTEPKPFGKENFWKKCTRILPRSHPVQYLYEYNVPEDVFREMIKDETQFTSDLVEGIYETQVPLQFRVLMSIGSLCSVDRKSLGKAQEVSDTFSLDQLNFRRIGRDYPYLDFSFLKFIWLYHHKSGSKNIFALFIPANRAATVFVLDTVRANQMPNLANLYNQIRNQAAKVRPEDSIPEANYIFDFKIETDIKRIYTHMQTLLESYKKLLRGPTVLLMQSEISPSSWAAAVPAVNEFPYVQIHISDTENLYSQLDWQKIGARMLIKHFLRVKLVLNSYVKQSRFFHIPIGNIPADPTMFGCDLLYARQLIKNGLVLWCSTDERPDLGGTEAFDNRLVSDFEEESSLVINHPGIYYSVCVELELDGLAVNTLLQAQHVNDIEGIESGIAFDTIQQPSLEEMLGKTEAPNFSSYDDTALCSHAFRALRTMVAGWLREVSHQQNVMADYQLIHFYRWLRCRNSFLFEPAIKKSLVSLMKKLFMQLVSEFVRLGSKIVFADFCRIIICTKKHRVADAISYVQFICAAIRNKDLFHSINIKVHHCWKVVMWMDANNYSGINEDPDEDEIEPNPTTPLRRVKKKRRNKSAESEKNQGDEESNETVSLEPLNLVEDEPQPETHLDMNWSLMNYLPDVGNCKHNFMFTIALFLTSLQDHLNIKFGGIRPGETPVARRLVTPTPRRGHNTPFIQNTSEFARFLVTDFTQRLLDIIQELNKKYPEVVKPEEESEKAIYRAPHYKMRKPALEFIKAIVKVFSIDPNIEDEVFKLRRNLLSLIHVGTFSDEAIWSDPSMSIILPEVICKVCVQCRDIDLCRDPHVKMENDLAVWFCPSCESHYETSEIEESLLDTLNRELMSTVLQDLYCKRCKNVKIDNMQKRCLCSGIYFHLIDGNQSEARWVTFRGIAKHFGMPLLLQNVEWVLRTINYKINAKKNKRCKTG